MSVPFPRTFIAVSLGLFLALGLLRPDPAVAQDAPALSITSQEATEGASVDVPIRASDLTDVGAVELTVTYDPDSLSFPSDPSTGDLIADAPREDFIANVPEPGELRISWFDDTASNPLSIDNDTLLALTFNAFSGESEVSFDVENSEITRSNGEAAGATFRDGMVARSLATLSLDTVRNETLSSTVAVGLSVEDSVPVGSISLEIEFAPSTLQFQGLSSDATNLNLEAGVDDGIVTIGGFNAEEDTLTGTFAELEFVFRGGATSLWVQGSSELTTVEGEEKPTRFVDGYVSGETPTLSLPDRTALPAETTRVALRASEVSNLGSASIRIPFSPDTLSFVGGAAEVDNFNLEIGTPEPGEVRVAGFNAGGVTPSDTIATLRFAVDETIRTPYETPLGFAADATELTSPSGLSYKTSLSSGSIGADPQRVTLPVESTFDSNREGWETTGDVSTPTHVASGGRPGGYIEATDNTSGSVWYWSAPSAFLGDASDAFEGSLRFDLQQSATDSQFDDDDLILEGTRDTLNYNFARSPRTTWTTYRIPLTPSAGWTLAGAGRAPTAQEMETVLSSLQGLKIRGEYRTGSDTGGLDNVRLQSGTAVERWVNPKQTYLHTNNDNALDAPAIDLATLGLSPGDRITLWQPGDYDNGKGVQLTETIVVFSGSDQLDPSSEQDRVPDAIDAGEDIETDPTGIGDEPTDIPEDFLADTVTVAIPEGATHMFVSPNDIFFEDNVDGDQNFRLRIAPTDQPPAGDPVVTSVQPDSGSSAGVATVTVYGEDFTEGVSVALERENHSAISGTVEEVSEEGTSLSARFDLTGREQGLWDLVVTGPDGTSDRLTDGFEIVSEKQPELWTNIRGGGSIVGGDSTTINVQVGNRGEVDVHDVVLYVRIPDDLSLSVEDDDVEGQEVSDWFDPSEFDPSEIESIEEQPLYVELDSSNVKLLPLWIPKLAAGGSQTLRLEVSAPDPAFEGSLEELFGGPIEAELGSIPLVASEFARTGDFDSGPPKFLSAYLDKAIELVDKSSSPQTILAEASSSPASNASASCSAQSPNNPFGSPNEQGKFMAKSVAVDAGCKLTGRAAGACEEANPWDPWQRVQDALNSITSGDCDPGSPGDSYNPSTCPSGGDCGPGGGGLWGDPHMQTLDQLAYDFQTVGEFILTRSRIDDLEIQGRMEQLKPEFKNFTVLTALAMNVAGDEVVVEEATSAPYEPTLQINGTSRELPEMGGDPITLSGGGTIRRSGQTIFVQWPDGRARVDVWQQTGGGVTGSRALSAEIRLSDRYADEVEGLLGDMDDKLDNEFSMRDGTVLQRPLSFDELYQDFGESWRIQQEESLFGTPTFADRSIPAEHVTTDELSPSDKQRAEKTCRNRGVDDPTLLNNCIFDLVLSGDSTFADDAAQLIGPDSRAQANDLIGEDEGKIQISLQTRPVDGRTFMFSGDGEIGEFTLTDEGADSISARTEVAYPLDPGTYEITQEQPGEDKWATDISCSPEEQVTLGVTDTTVTIDLVGGQSVRCTFHNVLEQIETNIRRSFGEASGVGDYQLVALPGAVDRPLGETRSGAPGTDWQAWWDNGAENDFLVRFDSSATFNFRTGRGFWMAATSDWTVESTVPTVSLKEDGTTKIPLNDGWTIISNPFGVPVDWRDVEAANDGDLQGLWPFDGAFNDTTTTLASAASGRAYYFLNDKSSRDSLALPHPGVSSSKTSSETTKVPGAETETALLALSARRQETTGPASTVRMGVAANGASEEVLVAPPGRFESISLRIEAETDKPAARSPERPGRTRLLMASRQTASGGGHTFQLRLRSRTDGPVRLSASRLSAIEGQEAVLLDPSEGRTYDLRGEDAVTIEPSGDEPRRLKVAVGSKQYVEQQEETVVPSEVTLIAYPNPVRQQGTIEYTLPEAQEVSLTVYDVLGRKVATLEQGRKKVGRHTVQLETDGLASGVYFGRLQAGDRMRTQKITVVR